MSDYVTVPGDTGSAEVQELRKSWNAFRAIFDTFTGGESVDDLKAAMDAADSGVRRVLVDPGFVVQPVGKRTGS